MKKDAIIVLAMHGVPPADFPRRELDEFFTLHGRLKHTTTTDVSGYERHAELEIKLRCWPRTEDNDPYQAASFELARELSRVTGCEVVVGFDEFCVPSMDDALDRAVDSGAERVIVVTPMVTGGGEHSEREIPAAISRARERHPGRRIAYAWPFAAADVAEFLAAQVARFTSPGRA